jgi:hypothetical protein
MRVFDGIIDVDKAGKPHLVNTIELCWRGKNRRSRIRCSADARSNMSDGESHESLLGLASTR